MQTIPLESLYKNISSLIKRAIEGEEVIFSVQEKSVAKSRAVTQWEKTKEVWQR